MKAFMYHYVRKNNPENPYSRHKDINEFKRECEYLNNIYNFCNIRDLNTFKNNNKPSIFLTFDDGLKDHLRVAEILNNMNLKGTFFIPIQPYLNKKILPVHKAQMICAKVGGESIFFMKKALDRLGINMERIIDKNEVDKFKNRYEDQNDNNKIKQFKKIINYIGKPYLIEKILDEIISELNIDDDYLSFYLSPEEINFISSLGFEIGSHGISHKPFSRLSNAKQDYELTFSKKFLEKLLNIEIVSFCFPYGRKSSYNDITLKLLKEKGYKYAVSIEERDINSVDLEKNNYQLPRFDCNQISKLFPEIKSK